MCEILLDSPEEFSLPSFAVHIDDKMKLPSVCMNH